MNRRRQSDLETHHQKTHSRINWLNYSQGRRDREGETDRDRQREMAKDKAKEKVAWKAD